jgi:hypothetical protein
MSLDLDSIKNNLEDENDEKDKKEKKYSTHTKFCMFGLNKCKKGRKCIFAHTFKQINPILCKWDNECLRKEKCYFKHSNETKVHYVKRAFPEDLKRLNINLVDDYKNDKNDKNDNLDDETLEENTEEYKQELRKAIKDLYLKYYDPTFEHYCWDEMCDFDSDIDIH